MLGDKCQQGKRVRSIHILAGSILQIWETVAKLLDELSSKRKLTKVDQRIKIVRISTENSDKVFGLRISPNAIYDIIEVLKRKGIFILFLEIEISEKYKDKLNDNKNDKNNEYDDKLSGKHSNITTPLTDDSTTALDKKTKQLTLKKNNKIINSHINKEEDDEDLSTQSSDSDKNIKNKTAPPISYINISDNDEDEDEETDEEADDNSTPSKLKRKNNDDEKLNYIKKRILADNTIEDATPKENINVKKENIIDKKENFSVKKENSIKEEPIEIIDADHKIDKKVNINQNINIKICSKCGNKNRIQAKFCDNCGNSLIN